MKIVHVCITGIWGEQYAYQENLLPHFHRLMGHEVAIIAATYSKYTNGAPEEEPVGESVLKDGTKLIRLASAVSNYKINGHLHLVKGLKESILHEKPNLLFVHDLACFNFSCLVSVKKHLPNVKIVFDNHADLVNSLHSPITKFLHKVLYRYFLAPKLLKVAEVFYGVTPSRCEFLHDIYGIPKCKIKLLVMGADDEKMDIANKEKLRVEVRNRFNIEESDFLIVTGGKIDKKKNIHLLANAVNNVSAKNVKLLVFGKISPDLEMVFEQEKSDRVQLIGWVNSDKVYELFYAADFVMFSGLHSVLWEQAIASKTPCAFTDIDGFRHVLFNNNCVLLTNNTEEYYKQLIEDLLDNPHKYDELKKNSDNEMTEKFYYSNIAKQVLQDVNLA